MKKYLFVICSLLVMALLFAGCGSKQAPSGPENLPQNNAEAEEIDLSDMVMDPGIQTDGKMDNSIKSFEKALAGMSLELEDKVAKDAVSIGAREGYGFDINGFGVELYLFDPASNDEKAKENLKTARESGFITIFGAEINGKSPMPKCTLNDSLVLIFPLEEYGMAHPDKEAIVQAFMKI